MPYFEVAASDPSGAEGGALVRECSALHLTAVR